EQREHVAARFRIHEEVAVLDPGGDAFEPYQSAEIVALQPACEFIGRDVGEYRHRSVGPTSAGSSEVEEGLAFFGSRLEAARLVEVEDRVDDPGGIVRDLDEVDILAGDRALGNRGRSCPFG